MVLGQQRQGRQKQVENHDTGIAHAVQVMLAVVVRQDRQGRQQQNAYKKRQVVGPTDQVDYQENRQCHTDNVKRGDTEPTSQIIWAVDRLPVIVLQ